MGAGSYSWWVGRSCNWDVPLRIIDDPGTSENVLACVCITWLRVLEGNHFRVLVYWE